MRKSSTIKLICLMLAFLMCFTSISVAFAENTTSVEETTEATTLSEEEKKEIAKQQLEEQKASLEADLEASKKKIEELSKSSKGTEEYINALDTKIGVLNKQLSVLDKEVISLEEDIDALEPIIEENQKQADDLQTEVDAVQKALKDLNEKFKSKYEAYCYRMRAIYISGSYNVITALITCSDISSFLTRYEMIKSVSKSDAELLASIEEQTNAILAQESDLNEKQTNLNKINAELIGQRDELQSKQNALTDTQNQIAEKKATLAQDKAESDALFAKLTQQTGMYTEFRNEDSALTEAIDKEINNLVNGIITADEVTNASTSDRSNYSTTAYTDKEVYSNSDAIYNMKYPVAGYYSVSAGFPNYSNGSYHGGIDFPCPIGTNITAVQKGVVLSVKKLTYSYGYYVTIYHGTDADGNKVISLYAHNSSILVSAGDLVSKGQVIAKSGSTGNSTGPHCHLEIRVNSTRVNPTSYLSK